MTMIILNSREKDKQEIIDTACRILASGGLVIYPTETVYGIGADATSQAAVDKLLQYKARREGKPLSIAVPNEAMASTYVELNSQAKNLYKHFLPGPITVVSKSKGTVANGVASERGTLGVRIPDYPLVREIVAAYGKPMTASSANASYKKRPYTVSDVLDNISEKQKERIDLIIDAGVLPHNEPSTVVDTTLEEPTVLRQGDIKLTDATTVTTKDETETQALGEKLVTIYRQYLNERALIFALVGEMGAGKTQLSKGIGKALGVNQPITSPTYTLSREYPFSYGDIPNQFVHIDTWRLFDNQEFLDLGFTRLIDNNAVLSVEWADKVKSSLDQYSGEAKIIWVKLEYGVKENERIITYSDDLVI